MNWVTIIWTAIASACLTLVAIHGSVWLQNRKAWGNLVFSTIALMVAVLAAVEFLAMGTSVPALYNVLIRWGHVPVFFLTVGLVVFVRLYLHAGRLWLAWTAVGVRLFSLCVNFLTGENLNFQTVSSLRPIPFFGSTIFIPEGVPNPWMITGSLSVLLLVGYWADATITVWRRGDRRRALIVGGSVIVSTLLPGLNVILVVQGVSHLPVMVSPFYVAFIATMGYELSRDLAVSAELAQRLQASEVALRESEQRMSLAARAAQLALWNWDIPRDTIWISSEGFELYGVSSGESINFARFLTVIHPEDRSRTQAAVEHCFQGNGQFRAEYRVKLPDGGDRWVVAAGQVEFDARRQPVRLRGVSLDVTDRRRAELEVDRQRVELAHLSRVATVSELSGSLAHELNQPLTAILSNAQAGLRFLKAETVDHEELRGILQDIAQDDQRAGEIIRRLRTLVKRGEVQLEPLDLNEVAQEIFHLVRGDLVTRNVTLVTEFEPGLPRVRGDRVQLQQVFLNLILNGCDALADNPSGKRLLTVQARRTDDEGVQIMVRDCGHGIPLDQVDRIFDPFVSTKASGLGLGLAISRSIVEAHGGRLQAANNTEGGARFSFVLPLFKDDFA